MKDAALKKMVEIFSHRNHLDYNSIPEKVRSVIAFSVAPMYLFIESLEPSGVSSSPDPIDGLLITQANRLFNVASGMISLLVLGHARQAEILSRTTMESALTLTYLSRGDSAKKFIQFFESYLAKEREQNRKWQKNLATYPDLWQRDHGERIKNKNEHIDAMEKWLELFASEIGVPFPSGKGFPNFLNICTELGKSIEYRTVYAAMCSQAHHDAEDTLNDLMVGTSSNEAEFINKLEIETENFSIFLVLHGARYFVECTGVLGSRYDFLPVIEQSEKSYSFLSDYLKNVCSGGFTEHSLRGWLPK